MNKQKTKKVYKSGAIIGGTFLGGPMVAGYMFAENFKALSEPEKAKSAWIISIIATVVIFGGIFLLPLDFDNFPRFIIPISYSAIAAGLFKKNQEEKVNEHLENSDKAFGFGRTFAVGIIGAFLTLLPVLGVAFTADMITQPNLSTKTYGLAVKHEIDYDAENISGGEVDSVADALIRAGFFDMSVSKYVYLVKDDNTYQINISVIAGTENDPEGLSHFEQLQKDLETYLAFKDVELQLAVDYIDNVVKVIK